MPVRDEPLVIDQGGRGPRACARLPAGHLGVQSLVAVDDTLVQLPCSTYFDG